MLVGIVRTALRRPYTFIVLALLLLGIGPLTAKRTPTDIFPEIRIPVIAVAWQYTGLPPEEMAGRISTLFQRALTTTVNDIEHIEANAYAGIGIVKIFFQPGVNVAVANAQVTAICQVGVNNVRPPLVTVPGAAIPYPYGGKQRQVQIDLDVAAMQARGLSAQDVANALAAQNLIIPIEEIGNMPIRVVNGATVYIRDVAHVHDGNSPQTNIVHVDGGRSVLKIGNVSTLAIVDGVRDNADAQLLPGGFATVSFELARPTAALSVPPSALLFDKAGLRVATVDADNKVVLKKVTIARDYGRFVEIGSGLSADDRVIESPPDGAADGDRVRIAEAAPGKGAEQARK